VVHSIISGIRGSGIRGSGSSSSASGCATPQAASSLTENLGFPNFTIVGLTDRAIQEARERVRASIRNAGFDFPMRRLTVNLAPAEIPKEGTGFDLATTTPSLNRSTARD
jgi:magnesium chelatase family protein